MKGEEPAISESSRRARPARTVPIRAKQNLPSVGLGVHRFEPTTGPSRARGTRVVFASPER